MRYYNLLNLPYCVDGPYGFVNNGDKVGALCPGPHAGFGCCRSNFHFAWPKFVQSLWMKTADNGLAATAYGPCTVTATAGGARMTVEETGTYPFGPDVKIAFREGAATFPLKLAYEDKTVGSYEVPCEKRTAGDLNGFPRHEIRATEPWNRALVLNAQGGVDAEVVTRDVPLHPFEPGSAPVSLKVKTFRTDLGGWGHTRDILTARAVAPPPSPVAGMCACVHELTYP